MRTAIDTNILSSIWASEPSAESTSEKMREAQAVGVLVISGFAYAEIHGYPNASGGFIRSFLQSTEIMVDLRMDERIWDEAGRRFARYADRRRRHEGVGPRRLLADYLIGAHALVQADRLLTLDPTIYRRDFPELILMG